eukprot:CAMPEP_0197081458 /NCGR_PEP_ID=MMETSP1384-20130603/214646_1 /TAXON_ID=29189 /ORGANISM="Ammonia sp." /LENGTH=502 /DNA_ID=CAMNT_0042520353 /DNA_START=82 /DNA_END=1588 /DNA_ORIENTATION=-
MPPPPSLPSRTPASLTNSISPYNSYSNLIKAVSPSIVNLVIESEIVQNFGFFQIQQPTKQLGTGVIVRSDGIIVTNNHVITTPELKPGKDQIITVYLSNSRKVHAHILLKDELNDLALLKIHSEDQSETFPFIEINDTSSIAVGDRVLAIGNNLGLHNTVTDGIISAIGRAQASQIQSDSDELYNNPALPPQLQRDMTGIKISKNPYLPFIQTNAAINQGSSGGALIDVETGKLIGINTAIASPIGVNIGIGFAVPSGYVLSLLRSLDMAKSTKAETRVIRPWDGLDVSKKVIRSQRLSPQIVQTLDELMNTTHPYYVDGVEIMSMHSQSPAMKAGLQIGDVLLMMDKRVAVDSTDTYWMTLAAFVPEQSVNYMVLRYDETTAEYKLLEFEVNVETPPKAETSDVRIRDAKNMFNGCLFGELQPELGIELGLNPCLEGVMLLEMPYQSMAAHSGFKPGDVLLEVDGTEIESVEQLKRLNLSRNYTHNIVIQRGDMVGEIIGD